MKTQLQFDEGAYDRLMQEVEAISNASFLMKDAMPVGIKHLHTRLDDATHKARRILVDEVVVVKEEDEDHPDLEKLADIGDMREDEIRGHVNLDADPPGLDRDITDLIREEEEA